MEQTFEASFIKLYRNVGNTPAIKKIFIVEQMEYKRTKDFLITFKSNIHRDQNSITIRNVSLYRYYHGV